MSFLFTLVFIFASLMLKRFSTNLRLGPTNYLAIGVTDLSLNVMRINIIKGVLHRPKRTPIVITIIISHNKRCPY